MIDENLTAVAELTQLSISEMEQVQGGTLNFVKIEFVYKPQKPDGTLG